MSAHGLTTKLKLIEDPSSVTTDISYISLSVDPEYDTSEVLSEYRQIALTSKTQTGTS